MFMMVCSWSLQPNDTHSQIHTHRRDGQRRGTHQSPHTQGRRLWRGLFLRRKSSILSVMRRTQAEHRAFVPLVWVGALLFVSLSSRTFLTYLCIFWPRDGWSNQRGEGGESWRGLLRLASVQPKMISLSLSLSDLISCSCWITVCVFTVAALRVLNLSVLLALSVQPTPVPPLYGSADCKQVTVTPNAPKKAFSHIYLYI